MIKALRWLARAPASCGRGAQRVLSFFGIDQKEIATIGNALALVTAGAVSIVILAGGIGLAWRVMLELAGER